jgi:hypothetical protein
MRKRPAIITNEYKHEWPSRAEWAKSVHTLHYEPEVSKRVSDYMTPPEIETLLRDLRERWKEIGRKLKTASEDDRDTCQRQRRCINRAIKHVSEDGIPIVFDNSYGAKDILAPLHKRYEDARQKAIKSAERAKRAKPVDDAAWAKELERRASVERYFGDGPYPTR